MDNKSNQCLKIEMKLIGHPDFCPEAGGPFQSMGGRPPSFEMFNLFSGETREDANYADAMCVRHSSHHRDQVDEGGGRWANGKGKAVVGEGTSTQFELYFY
ncbi:hypothetical protein NC652_015699 [Populus alba x Populus x berolinensis]|nr:hypothetical protein NC652_015699 [Populus alba x Populus x berolinensis]